MKMYWSDKAGFVINVGIKVNFDAPGLYFQRSVTELRYSNDNENLRRTNLSLSYITQ